MFELTIGLPPLWVMQGAVAFVWLYEGLWCKLLGREPRQRDVVAAVPRFGAAIGGTFLVALGVVEVVLALWVLSRVAPHACAIAQVALLVALNTAGVTFARHIIHDPAGMVVKNLAFLVLAWTTAALQAP